MLIASLVLSYRARGNMCLWWYSCMTWLNVTGALDGAGLQNIYSADIVSWLANYAEWGMNLNVILICTFSTFISTNMLLFS